MKTKGMAMVELLYKEAGLHSPRLVREHTRNQSRSDSDIAKSNHGEK